MTSKALSVTPIDPVSLTQALVRCKSITPDEGGALTYLQSVLEPAGFTCHRLTFSAPGTPDVDNLYARIGTSAPHLCFAGHTDVVPPGPLQSWRHPPFAAEIVNGVLYGRGAADMKGGIACFLAATLDYLAQNGLPPKGSISFLITGDEEGPAVNGTIKMLQWLKQNGEKLDHCLVGEPSNPEKIGDAIKIGRRGSLNGVLTITGKQGHAAYPHLANNPIPGLLKVLDHFLSEPLDQGTAHFMPSNLEITSVDVGNPAVNVIPERAQAQFNIRFNDSHSGNSLMALLRNKTATALQGTGLDWDINFQLSGESFLTEPGFLSTTLAHAIEAETGHKPELSTSGGTSDARFIKDYCPVIEFGLVNATIHKVDERVPVSDLECLTRIYRRFIDSYFKASA